MRIEELSPEKFYAVIIESGDFSQEDLNRVSEKFKEKGLNVIVTGGDASYEPLERWWGVYDLEDKRWAQMADGRVYHYPAPGIAQAHLECSLSEMAHTVDGRDNQPQYKLTVREMTYGNEQDIV